jgi:hypothetical protein
MDPARLFDTLPLWTILPLTIALALLAVELGYRFARYRQRRSEGEKEVNVGGMVGAMLGLFAFMLAFTFGFASSRYQDRRQLVLTESNAIGTTYLRTAMIPEPMSTDAKRLLREYVDVRLEAVKPGQLEQGMIKSEELQKSLWSTAVAAVAKERSPTTSLFVQSLNQLIDLHAQRVMAGTRSRVPGVIWIVLYLLAVLTMLMMGYQTGLAGTRRSIAVIALIVGFSSVLFLIADLDRPGQGMLSTTQEALVDLRRSM